jgi:hypothetical protein
MIAALLLLTVSLTDLAAARSTRPRGLVLPVLVALVVSGAGWLGLGVPVVVAAVVAALAIAWLVVVTAFTRSHRSAPLLAGAVVLGLMVAVAVVVEPLLVAVGPTVPAYEEFARATGFGVPLRVVVGAVATALFLTRPANLICRAALGRSLADEESSVLRTPRRWSLSIRSRQVAQVEESPSGTDAAESVPQASLKGGRVIGPLERLLITALALVGAEAVVVALIAAKGIVRFPEISADGRNGSKAEEFLVGSLVSWTLAGLGAAFVTVLRLIP